MAQKHSTDMKKLLILLLLAPVIGCSQDLGFWEGTPEQERGCKNWRIVTNSTSPLPIAFALNITDCWGNEKSTGYIFNSTGATYHVCSMTMPTGGSTLVQSITQDGWCTDPIGSSWDFWLESSGLILDPFPSHMSEVYIYSADAGGTNRNLIYSTTTPQNIVGANNSVTVNDTFAGQGYYVIRVRARRDGAVPIDAFVYVRPGTSQRIAFSSTSMEYKEIVVEKREFYLQFTQG